MAPSKTTKTKSKPSSTAAPKHSAIGAPSQYSNPNRRGKKAWRKNIDISEVEEGMEVKREEERAGVGSV